MRTILFLRIQHDSVTIEETYRLFKRAGYHMEQIRYQDWVEMIQQSPDSPLQPMLSILRQTILKGLTRMQTSMETPVYDTQKLYRHLQIGQTSTTFH
jgi:ABC-type dipeptide/oligopeptide/nickel transport system ATPase component